MPIKTTIATLQAAVPALNHLAGLKMPVKAAYSVSKLIKVANAELQLFEEQRSKLIKELGSENEKGDFAIAPGTEAMDKFMAEMKPLLETEVELPVNPLTIDMLGAVELPPAVLLQLEPFIIEEVAV